MEEISKNWLLITGGVICLFLLLIFWLFWPKPLIKKPCPNFIFCPLRKKCYPKYDSRGSFTEEYQRIRLIIYFLKKGYARSTFKVEYPLEKSFGHQGHSKVKILVDLVLEKEDQILIVAEVKKGYHPEKKKSAIEHQLKPAMAWTNAKYGIYFDGTEASRCLIRKRDGTVQVERFPA